MKLVLFLAAFLCVSTAYADPKTDNVNGATPVSPTVSKQTDTYECPQCHMTSDKPGKCPHCNVDLVKKSDAKAAAYVCAHCGTSADAPGKCPKCGMDMTKAECPDCVEKQKKMKHMKAHKS